MLLVVSVVTFVLMHAIPGGPFTRERALPSQIIENLNRKYNLDAPLVEQYSSYMGDLLIPRVAYGRIKPSVVDNYLVNIPLPSIGTDQPVTLRWMNFGPSFKQRSLSVNDIFRDHLPVSFQLGVAAMIVTLAIGIPAGTVAAIKRNTIYDYVSMSIAIIGVSVPIIILGPVLQYIFAVDWKVLPLIGWGTLQHFVLPAFSLGLAFSALIARLTRASLLQVLNEDFIRTARAKGLRERRVFIVHATKNSMIAVVTVLGPTFAALVTGSFVTETVFNIPGMGRYFVESVTNRDYTVIMGTILLYATFIVIGNVLVDIAYGWLDPRIRND